MNFSWWTFALQAANFLILVWLLQRFLFKPVKAIVARRKEEIARGMAEASAEKESAERMKRELQERISGIEAERQRILDEQRAQLAALRQKCLEETREEAGKIKAQALARLNEERSAAVEELFGRTVDLAANLAERLLRELAIPSIEQAFLSRVTDYLDRLPDGERAALFSQLGGDHGPLAITTAHPLDPPEEAAWRDQLAKRIGAAVDIRFAADPALIAGAEIAFPQAILRFNWRDSLAAARAEIRHDDHAR